MMKPLNLLGWIDKHREDFKPPVGNRKIWEDTDFDVFVVGGPNARKDFHIDPSEEFFYQIEGEMTLKIVNEDGDFQDITIGEGEIFLLPSMVPHSPQRGPNTIGLVIEHKRAEGAMDGLRWYCDECHEVVHETFFVLEDIVSQLRAAIQGFWNDDELRTCKACGHYLTQD